MIMMLMMKEERNLIHNDDDDDDHPHERLLSPLLTIHRKYANECLNLLPKISITFKNNLFLWQFEDFWNESAPPSRSCAVTVTPFLYFIALPVNMFHFSISCDDKSRLDSQLVKSNPPELPVQSIPLYRQTTFLLGS